MSEEGGSTFCAADRSSWLVGLIVITEDGHIRARVTGESRAHRNVAIKAICCELSTPRQEGPLRLCGHPRMARS
jgi:hypothetical protein